MTAQFCKKRGASFDAIGERLVLSSNAEDGSEKVLVDKELKQKQQFDKIDRMVKGTGGRHPCPGTIREQAFDSMH